METHRCWDGGGALAMKLDDKGNVAIVVALCLPLIIGGAAFGVEVGYWRYDQVRLQQAADAAAYAGAVVKRAGGSTVSAQTVTDAATAAAVSNGFVSGSDTINVYLPSNATPADANSVEAVISRTEAPIFSAYVHCFVTNWANRSCANTTTVVTASATASYSDADNACILALSPTASAAADFAGNSSITLDACTVMSNSLASNAVNVQGSATLSVPCMYATGGASLGGTVDLTTCGAVKTDQPPVADPYASLARPTVSGSCTSASNSGTLDPGNYCSMDLKNTVTLNPGVYIINGGSLKINANAAVTGSGVTFYLTNGATLSMNGNSDVQLSAPTSGTYSGMLFISDRSNSSSISINGDSTSTMTGVIYAPDASVSYIGNFGGANGCTQIVAQTVSWSGNASFSANCSSAGMSPVQVGSVVRLSA